VLLGNKLEAAETMKRAAANETEIDPSVFDFVYKLLSGDLVAHGPRVLSRAREIAEYAVAARRMRQQKLERGEVPGLQMYPDSTKL